MDDISQKKIVIAAVTMNCTKKKGENLEKYRKFIEEAAASGTRLIVFPEISLQGHVWDMVGETTKEEESYHYENAEPIPGQSTQIVAKEAQKFKMYVIFGMTEKATVRGKTELYDSCVLVGPDGLIGTYRKVHTVGNEVRLFKKGECWPVYGTEIGKIGMLSCYDRVFPESTRELALQGADILAILNAWSVGTDDPEPAYWGSLGSLIDRARAFENQCWIISSNQTEWQKKGGLEYYGHSRIVSPNGLVVAEGGYGEGLVTAEVDIQGEIQKTRTVTFFGLNFLNDRRVETYKELLKK